MLYFLKLKPLELIRGKDNKFEGYLYPSKAHKVKVEYYLIVETEKGVRIICTVEKIECTEENYPGQTSSHHEEVYKIKLNPEGQFTQEGYEDLETQTIISGKIKFPTEYEYMVHKKIPQNGIAIGTIEQAGQPISYHFDKNMLYQSTFIGGVQGTGKTSSIKNLSINLAQSSEAPAQIIIDNEAEYGDLPNIPSNKRSQEVMKHLHLTPIAPENFQEIKIRRHGKYCLTLKAINPMDLPYFLRELTSVSIDSLLIIIDDIMEDHPDREFTLPELRAEIFSYMGRAQYELAPQTQQDLRRALTSHYLKIFDVPGAIPIEIDTMLQPGNITVINTNAMPDDFQRIVALYFLAMLHKKAMKGTKNIRLVLILDEVQRLLPKSRSTAEADYLKRITGLLDEILHRGRKRHYGVMFATQSPLDVKKEIIDLCNTKIFFQIQGKGLDQLSEYLDKDTRERLKRLPVGQAFITSKGKHEPVEIKFPFLD